MKLLKKVYASLFAVASLCGVACFSDHGSESEDELSDLESELFLSKNSSLVSNSFLPPQNFAFFQAGSKISTLGSNNQFVKPNEKPLMSVDLDYPFFISLHEVTQGEFAYVMNRPAPEGSLNFPQNNVTFYDAVLYANALSKIEGRDTAYTYSRADFDFSMNCVYLEGLVTHYDVMGYRLPTEAEWIYVASKNWRPENSWHAGNSSYELHDVCSAEISLGVDSLHVCDMAGSLMEWVDGWLSPLKDTSLVNFVGGCAPNGLGERIVKGGAFLTEATSMNMYSRGDVYSVTSATYADYVGFRLAMGVIPNPVTLSPSGSVESSRMNSLISVETMKNLTGTRKAKLAFRNDVTGNLAYVDYEKNANMVVEIKDSLEVYHPDISPDGNFVAFCTKVEGVSGVSELYVRKLDSLGTGLVKLQVPSAAIPRFRVLDSGDTVIVYVTDAGDNKDYAAWKQKSTWQVSFANGQFGVPQKLFDGSYNGGVSKNNAFAVSGSTLLRSAVLQGPNMSEAVWYNGEQACNVSLSKDGSGRTLFLDFGAQTGMQFAGHSYGVHQELLVMNSAGALVQAIDAPTAYSFDHTEWASDRNLVVTALSNVDGAHEKIALVDLSDSSIHALVESDELWHPCLWLKDELALSSSSQINPDIASSSSSLAFAESSSESYKYSYAETRFPVSIDRDSAGIYLFSQSTTEEATIRYKMELLWQYQDRANVVVVGSSRPLDGIMPKLMSNDFFALNLAQTPNSIYYTRDFLNRYVFNHFPNLRYIVISLDIDFWWKENKSSTNFFFDKYKKYPGYVYDENHNFWETQYSKQFLDAVHNAQGAYGGEDYLESLGYLEYECVGWPDNPRILGDSLVFDKNPELLENSRNVLKEIIANAAKRNIVVVGVIFPMAPSYKNTGTYGPYGIRRSLANELINEFAAMEKTEANFVLMDENKGGNHDYTSDMAYDTQHLCFNGAKQFTSRLDSFLKSLNESRFKVN